MVVRKQADEVKAVADDAQKDLDIASRLQVTPVQKAVPFTRPFSSTEAMPALESLLAAEFFGALLLQVL